MRDWIRKVLGIDTIDKIINDSNTATQTKLENISKLLETNSETNDDAQESTTDEQESKE